MQIAACILAAGAGQRMGQDKAEVRLAGRSFVDRLLGSFASAGTAPLFVVARSATPGLVAACTAHGAQLRLNPDPDRGMLSSLHVCLRALMQGPNATEIAALFVTPVDCPRVRPETTTRLASAFDASGAPLVLPLYQGRRGHPVLFGVELFEELLAAPLDVGARAVVWAHAADRIEIEMDDAGVLDDLDTPAAVAALQRKR